MPVEAQQIVVLLLFAVVLAGLNLKAGDAWLRPVTLFGSVACLAAAGWLVVKWVFL